MIELRNVTKFFTTGNEKKYILKNVSFVIPPGKNLGILGRNGAGKSTFLRMLGGIDFPTSGEILSDQSFSWPMGLAGGFQGSMTGRQNVKFVCRVYGKTDEDMNDIIAFVQEFAEIGDYFDMPIKIYSSGMRSRLSFGLSLAFDFDYLIIDETLSVGDQNFKKKAKEALLEKIKTCNILFVSHSIGELKKLCDAGVVLENGELKYFDKIDEAVNYYHQLNLRPFRKGSKVQSSALFCSDGKVFDNVNNAAQFYKVRPMSILQALDENKGSNVYLKKVFWRDGQEASDFQPWQPAIDKQTIITSDGIIFADALEAASFYVEKFPDADVDEQHIDAILQSDKSLSDRLKVRFYFLSEFDEKIKK